MSPPEVHYLDFENIEQSHLRCNWCVPQEKAVPWLNPINLTSAFPCRGYNLSQMKPTTHPYDGLVTHLREALRELQRLNMGPSLSKGRVGEILLAHELGHTLHLTQRGADGIGPDGKKYEYKVSHDDQFNFNFGHARGSGEVGSLVDRHFRDFEGAYCGLMDGAELTKLVYCPVDPLREYLRKHLRTVKGETFQKVFSPIERFADLPSAVWIRRPA